MIDRYLISFAVVLMLVIPVEAQASRRAASKRTPADAVKKEQENIPADRISIHQLKRKLDAKEKIVIVDARAGSAWIGSLVKIKGAVHITLDDLEARMKELPKNREIIAYCA